GVWTNPFGPAACADAAGAAATRLAGGGAAGLGAGVAAAGAGGLTAAPRCPGPDTTAGSSRSHATNQARCIASPTPTPSGVGSIHGSAANEYESSETGPSGPRR